MKRKKTSFPQPDNIQYLETQFRHFSVNSDNYHERAQGINLIMTLYYNVMSQHGKAVFDSESGAMLKMIRTWIEKLAAEAYSPDLAQAYTQLQEGNAAGLESLIRFLEIDPAFFRSGYDKAKIIRYLKPHMIKASDMPRLQRVVLHIVDTRDDRDFRAFCRLARKVDTPQFREELTRRIAEQDKNIRRRARWVLEALEK